MSIDIENIKDGQVVRHEGKIHVGTRYSVRTIDDTTVITIPASGGGYFRVRAAEHYPASKFSDEELYKLIQERENEHKAEFKLR